MKSFDGDPPLLVPAVIALDAGGSGREVAYGAMNFIHRLMSLHSFPRHSLSLPDFERSALGGGESVCIEADPSGIYLRPSNSTFFT